MDVAALARSVGAPVARQVRVDRWPAALGRFYGIHVPHGVVPLPERSARGSAHVGIVLDLLDRTRDVPGDVAECGVYRGGTLVPITLAVRHHRRPRHVFGFDSFQGFDDTVEIDVALGGQEDGTRRVHGFDDTSRDLVQRKIDWLGLGSTATLVPGYFQDTLAPAVADRTFAFVHLDCDLYQSYKDCLEFFWPRVAPGGIVLFDEYDDPSWPGCNLAVDEFVGAAHVPVERIERDNYVRAYLVKPPA